MMGQQVLRTSHGMLAGGSAGMLQLLVVLMRATSRLSLSA